MTKRLRLLSIVATLVLMAGCASTEKESPSNLGKLELASQFIQMGDYRNAITALQEARNKNNKDYRVEGMLGIAYMGLGDFPAASFAFERSITINKDDLDSRLNLSFALTVQKKYPEARKELDRILDSGRFNALEKVYNNYGLTFLQERKCDAAMKRFKEALQIDPTFVSAHYNLGRCQMMKRNYPAAIENLKKALEFCPDCADPALELARAQNLAGQKKAAVAQLENVLSGRPDRATEERTRKLLQEIRR